MNYLDHFFIKSKKNILTRFVSDYFKNCHKNVFKKVM
jgi:hypothetical protein